MDLDTQIFELKLFWSLLKKSGCLFQATYVITAISTVLTYIVLPDFIPGPVDDFLVAPWLVPFVLSKIWILFLPKWFVEEQKLLLKKKLSTKPVVSPQSSPTANKTPKRKAVNDWTIVVTRNKGWSTFHLMPRLSDIIRSNHKLKNELKGVCELKENGKNFALLVEENNEAKVVQIISKRVSGLKIIFK